MAAALRELWTSRYEDRRTGALVPATLSKAQALATRFGDDSNLALDPDLDSYYVQSIIVRNKDQNQSTPLGTARMPPAWHRAPTYRTVHYRGDKLLFQLRPSRRALYLQVRDVLAKRIAEREWRPGFAVPNESDLARDLGVSSGTVRKALNLLETDRLITRRQGKGTFVNDQASDELACRFIRLRTPDGESCCGEVKSRVVSKGAASELECTRLQLRAGDSVYRIRRVRHHGGRPFLVAAVTLPAALFPRLAEKCDIPDQIGALAPWNGVLLGRAEERVSICAPPAEVRDLLGIASGTPVMLLDCVLFLLGTNRPAAWRIGHAHLPDGYYFAEWS
jgi:GntR family transcriptional regulator